MNTYENLPPALLPSTSPDSATMPLWMRPSMREAAGDTLRPGGFSLTDRLAELAGIAPGWRVLDAGCGLGASVLRLRQRYGATSIGTDRSIRQIAAARSAVPHAPLLVADTFRLPFRPQSMHMVLCECALSLLPNPKAALHGFHTVLAPGGLLGLTDLYLRESGNSGCAEKISPPSHHDHVPPPPGSCLGWNATRDALEQMLHETGFRIRIFEDHSPLLGELAARLVFAGESPCGLLPASPSSPCPTCSPPAALRVRPGYFLLLAERS